MMPESCGLRPNPKKATTDRNAFSVRAIRSHSRRRADSLRWRRRARIKPRSAESVEIAIGFDLCEHIRLVSLPRLG